MQATDTISAEGFFAELEKQSSLSTLLAFSGRLDVSELSDADQRNLAKRLRNYSQTKHGPMLLLSLPGPLQAMLSFSGVSMPGQDRLAYRKATPRQVVNRLATHHDVRLLNEYPFERVTKADWAYYLSRAKRLIVPCMQFLNRSPDHGGFSHLELLSIAKVNALVVSWIKPEETTFQEAYELYLSGNGDALWKIFPFKTLTKDEWLVILKNADIDIPVSFEDVIRAGMFSPNELLLLAESNDRAYLYVSLGEIEPETVVSSLLRTDSDYLWQNYDFARLDAVAWAQLICERKDSRIIPRCEELRTAKGLTTQIVEQILAHDARYVRYVPLELVERKTLIELMSSGNHEWLWNVCDFSRFSKEDWYLLFSKTTRIPSEFEEVVERGVFSSVELCIFANRNEGFVEYLPLENLSEVQLIDLLLLYRNERLWNVANLRRLTAKGWGRLIASKNTFIGEKFASCLRDVKNLTKAQVKNILEVDLRYAAYLKPSDIEPDQALKVVVKSASSKLWQEYDFGCFSHEQLVEISKSAEPRTTWPSEIIKKFSTGKDAFTDDLILEIAACRARTVLDLVTVKRIQKSGTEFFGKLCDLIAASASLIDVVVCRLSEDGNPWQELPRDFQMVLLLKIPECRTVIDWQSFDARDLKRLVDSNAEYRKELHWGAKFRLLMERAWPLLLILFAIGLVGLWYYAHLQFQAARARMDAERASIERQRRQARLDEIAEQIRGHAELCEYDELERCLENLKTSSDAEALQDARVVAAQDALLEWRAKQEEGKRCLARLKEIATKGWPDECAAEVVQLSSCVEVDVLTLSERDEFYSLRRRWGIRHTEIERAKKNTELEIKLKRLEASCETCSSIDSAQKMIAEVGSLLAHDWVSEENQKNGNAVKVKLGETVKELKRRLAEEQEKRSREDVCKIHKEIELIKSELDSLDWDATKGRIAELKARFDAACARSTTGYARYRQEYSAECDQVARRVQTLDSVVARFDFLTNRVAQTAREFGSHVLGDNEKKSCLDLQKEMESWRSQSAEAGMKVDSDADSMKKSIVLVLSASDEVESLIAKANSATDYETLYKMVAELLKKYSEYDEVREIDGARILDTQRVASAIKAGGWFLPRQVFDFAGLIKVNPRQKGSVVPVVLESARGASEIYCMVWKYDFDYCEWLVCPLKVFEKSGSGFKKVQGFDYSRCQGIGLFVKKDSTSGKSAGSSRVENLWIPGKQHPDHPHWVMAQECGKWVVEPGYEKASLFTSQFGDVVWEPHREFLGGEVRTGEKEGVWERRHRLVNAECEACEGTGAKLVRGKCAWCKGSGRVYVKLKSGQWSAQSRRCERCGGRGYCDNRSATCVLCEGTGRRSSSWWERMPAQEVEFTIKTIAREMD